MIESEAVFILNKHSRFFLPGRLTSPVKHAIEILFRDLENVLGYKPKIVEKRETASVILRYAVEGEPLRHRPEAFWIHFLTCEDQKNRVMVLSGSDDLGIVYGLLYLSNKYLGVDPFWFWTDQKPQPKDAIVIPVREYLSSRPKVAYRGWFVNDEVCLIGWTDSYPPPREIWFPVFETLLRCGGNMVIPGTDLPKTGIHWKLALEMGLYITHHHAEPLGAEMFFRVYPDKEASYDRNEELFVRLWEESVRSMKEHKVIWVLGFRGQGDCPFWEQDPAYTIPECRGELITRVIHRQYELVYKYVSNPVCATYLYGEMTELYRDGYLRIPDGVIKIWSDNGYGKMVSRRQGAHNPRVSSLPMASEAGPHGLYYHVTFHDLQASNHLTMAPYSSSLIKEELLKSFRAGADYFLLVNCGNIKPHIYPLEIVSRIWSDGAIHLEEHLNTFSRKHFQAAWQEAKECYQNYFDTTITYGYQPDERAGEEYYHHPARAIIHHWLRGSDPQPARRLVWATGVLPFPEQIQHFYEKLSAAVNGWMALHERCLATAEKLGVESGFFRDHLLLQVTLHFSGNKGFLALCQSYFAFKAGNIPLAFVYASQASWDYSEGLQAIAASEHDKWQNFYRADWLTNVKSTLYSLDALRKFLRVHGDSPDFFLWYKEFLMPETEKKIYLENTHRNPLSDDELGRRLKAKFLEHYE